MVTLDFGVVFHDRQGARDAPHLLPILGRRFRPNLLTNCSHRASRSIREKPRSHQQAPQAVAPTGAILSQRYRSTATSRCRARQIQLQIAPLPSTMLRSAKGCLRLLNFLPIYLVKDMKTNWNSISHTASIKLHPQLLEAAESIRKVISEQQRLIEETFGPAMRTIGECMTRFRETFPNQIRILARHGWFASHWHTPLDVVPRAAALFEKGEVAKGHLLMCRHFAEIEAQIEEDLTRDFPARARIIRKAFRAHRAGDHELSIPVFLAQADGIAEPVLTTSIYTRGRTTRRTIGRVVNRVAKGDMERELLRLVLRNLPLTASRKQEGELSRHKVLHGEDIDYPSKLNGFRAISFMQYAAYFVETKRLSHN